MVTVLVKASRIFGLGINLHNALFRWLSNYMSDEQQEALKAIIDDDSRSIEYNDYNWEIC